MAKRCKVKVVSSGHILEVYEYGGLGIWCDYVGLGGRTEADAEVSEDAEANRLTASRRARQSVVRQVNANFGTGECESKFVTLTFRDGAVPDVTDVQACNKVFKDFMLRLRRAYGDFKYLAVVEFQDGRGRGAVHYHMIVTLPYVKAKELADLWGHGFIRINRISHVDNIGAYMVKYMVKSITDTRLKGQKAYLGSRNLDKPTVLRDEEARAVLAVYRCGTDVQPSYSATYTLPKEAGDIDVTYAEFNLRRPTGQL